MHHGLAPLNRARPTQRHATVAGHYPNQTTGKPSAACFILHVDAAAQEAPIEHHFYMRHNLNLSRESDACSAEGAGCVPLFKVEAFEEDSKSSCMLTFVRDTVSIRYRAGGLTLALTAPNSPQHVVPWSTHHASPLGWLSEPPFDRLIKLQWYRCLTMSRQVPQCP